MKTAHTYGLSHIAIAVSDLDRTLAFYKNVFDVEVMYHKENFLQVTTPGSNDIIVFEKKKSGLWPYRWHCSLRFPIKKCEGY